MANGVGKTTKKLTMLAASAGAVGAASNAGANILHSTTALSVTGADSAPTFVDWDVDGDASIDFRLGRSIYFTYADFAITSGSLPGGGFVVNTGAISAPYRMLNLGGGFSVGPTLAAGYAFGYSSVYFSSTGRLALIYGGSVLGSGLDLGPDGFIDGTDGFLGFQFTSNGNTHYGWARVEFDADAGVQDTTNPDAGIFVKEWAYETSPNTAIQVGVIPEPHALALLALGGSGLLAWRRRRSQAK